MGLRDLDPTLRPPERLRNDQVSAAKVALSIEPGAELEVPAGIADQLRAADPHFVPVDGDLKAQQARARALEAEAADERDRVAAAEAHAALERLEGLTDEQLAALESGIIDLPPGPAAAAETLPTPARRRRAPRAKAPAKKPAKAAKKASPAGEIASHRNPAKNAAKKAKRKG